MTEGEYFNRRYTLSISDGIDTMNIRKRVTSNTTYLELVKGNKEKTVLKLDSVDMVKYFAFALNDFLGEQDG
jgi:hypothetical protein